MPKVISGVQGARDFATDGKVQTIPDVTNRQGARQKLSLTVQKAVEAALPKPDTQESVKAPETVGQKPPEEPVKAQESAADDANDGVEDQAWPEAARKAIASKHRQLREAKDKAVKALADLTTSENWGKNEYARAQAAQERVEELQKEIAQLKEAAPKPPPVDVKKPDSKDPKFYDEQGKFKLAEYTEAVAQHAADIAVNGYRTEQDKKREEESKKAQEEAQKAAKATMDQRIAVQSKDYEDWESAVVNGPEVRMRNVVTAFVANNPNVGHYMHYLTTHPDYVEALNKMNPYDAIAELGELGIRWKKKPEAEKPKEVERQAVSAPISVLPGTGSAGVNTDPSKMTPAQLRAYDRERAIAKRAAR